MLEKLTMLRNKNVAVAFDHNMKTVVIFKPNDLNKPVKIFSGYQWIEEKFNGLIEWFDEDMGLSNCISLFEEPFPKLNISLHNN